MKTLLKFLYFFILLVILVMLAGIFLPKKIRIQSSVSIGAPVEIVFQQVNDFKNWKNWSPWYEADSTMEITFGDKSSGTGAYYKWKSVKLGDGSMKIEQSIPDKSIKTYIDFGEKGNANGAWEFERVENKTIVRWAFEDDNLEYFERYFMLLFQKKIKTDLASGLKNLKNVGEELRLSRVSEVKLVDMELQPAMIIVDSSNLDGMRAKMAAMFDMLAKYLEKRKFQPTGPPFTIYYSWNTDSLTKFACGFPIEKRTWGWKQYEYTELPEGKVAKIIHWGKYNSEKPWLTLDQYLNDHNLEMAGAPWEVYFTDPTVETDTSKWVLEVYYPVK